MYWLVDYFKNEVGSYLDLSVVKYYNRKLYLSDVKKVGADVVKLEKDLKVVEEVLRGKEKSNQKLTGYVSLADLELFFSSGMKVNVKNYKTGDDLTRDVFFDTLKYRSFTASSMEQFYKVYLKAGQKNKPKQKEESV